MQRRRKLAGDRELLSNLKALEPAKREDVVEDIIKGINIQQRKI